MGWSLASSSPASSPDSRYFEAPLPLQGWFFGIRDHFHRIRARIPRLSKNTACGTPLFRAPWSMKPKCFRGFYVLAPMVTRSLRNFCSTAKKQIPKSQFVMKPITTLAALCALTAAALGSATDPVGYVTQTIVGKVAPTDPDVYNLLGVTLHGSKVAAGDLTGVSATSVSASADFDALLSAGSTYVLRITSGAQAGAVVPISDWGTSAGLTSADLETAPNDLAAAGVLVGDSFELRLAPTISSVFGPNNEIGLKEASSITSADVIWLPTGGGGFAKYFYHPGASFPVPVAEGWKNSSGQPAANTPIIYSDGLFVQRRAVGNLSLVVTGEVILSDTKLLVEAGLFNYVGSVFPVGSTLGNSGLESGLQAGTSISTADVVWLPNGSGGYNKFFYHPGASFPVPVAAGWKTSAGADASAQPLTPGMIIQRRGGTTVNVTVSVPTYGL